VRLRDLMNCPVVVDLRNIYQPDEMQRYGFAYTGIGRPFSATPFAADTALDQVVSLANVRARAPSL